MSGLALLGVIAVVAFFIIGLYNGLVSKRIAVENGWSQIDVQLKRRYDLIPNLVETVKGYAGHEKQTLEAVVNARNAAMGSAGSATSPGERAAAENALSGTLKTLFALQEAYPDLKANQNFLSLQEELGSTENQISAARQSYNNAVSSYMTALQSFPSNIIGNTFGFQRKEFFELDAAEAKAARTAPQVKF